MQNTNKIAYFDCEGNSLEETCMPKRFFYPMGDEINCNGLRLTHHRLNNPL